MFDPSSYEQNHHKLLGTWLKCEWLDGRVRSGQTSLWLGSRSFCGEGVHKAGLASRDVASGILHDPLQNRAGE